MKLHVFYRKKFNKIKAKHALVSNSGVQNKRRE